MSHGAGRSQRGKVVAHTPTLLHGQRRFPEAVENTFHRIFYLPHDESVGKLADVDETVLVDADVDEGAEGVPVGTRAVASAPATRRQLSSTDTSTGTPPWA